jgi:hypothetical protein
MKFEGAAPTGMVPMPNILNGKVLPTPAKVVKHRQELKAKRAH